MNFPLDLWDISLFLAVLSIILLPPSQLISRRYRLETPVIRRLEAAALTVSVLFIITVLIRIISIFFDLGAI